jgi:hypothetical protein
MKCPICESERNESQNTEAFQFRKNRHCKQCGTIWTPGAPRWAAALSVICGVLVCLFGGLLLFTSDHSESPHARILVLEEAACLVLVAGPGAIWYGLKNIQGGAHDVIIKAGSIAEYAPQSDVSPRSEIRLYHLLVAVALPPVALVWGLLSLMRERFRAGALMILISSLEIGAWIAYQVNK